MTNEEDIKKDHAAIIKRSISHLDKVSYETVSKLIPQLLAKGIIALDTSSFIPVDSSIKEPQGVGRFLIYDHDDKNNPFSIWIFAFAPGQKTSIHDHKYKGTVMVLNGPISEKYYLPTSENTASIFRRANRNTFHTNVDNLTSVFVHQLKNRQDADKGIILTLHIYAMEAQMINDQDERVDRRNFDTIYIKDRSVPKTNPKVYEEAFDEDEPHSSSLSF